MKTSYQQCINCLLDTNDDPFITFDENGVCSYCKNYKEQEQKNVSTGIEAEQKINFYVNEIKKAGRGKKYDCILGLSGGVDSTYVAYLTKKFGLRPLAVHFDNGWNSEIAVKNIENIVSKLDFDLFTYVINWEEFRDLQLAYLKASVVDIEAITDHAIIGTLYKLAAKNKIKYILSGTNVVTEAILPNNWIFDKWDHVNIVDIHKHYGTIPLKTFPLFNTIQKKYYVSFKGIKTVSLLNLVPYNKKKVKQIISSDLNWRDYGGKHHESVFTRFYQGYILPVKFGIDKRKAHLSNLICSGQITREEALEDVKNPIYDPELLENDKVFVIKKLGLSETEFNDIMKQPRREHTDFKTEKDLLQQIPILKLFKPLVKILKNK